ncbi:MAG: hypothetical protein HY235_28475, partial [Acidobacteria bacterium]|nr:hypothetical protein [Acidobacteriota bacterium]
MAFFDKIENRYVIEGTLHSEAGLHIGTGVAGTTTDAPFIRMNNLPYVPGSSLRGVLRSTAERLLETLWPGQQCVNFEALSTCASDSESEQVERSLAENEAVSFCDVCKFFGSTNLAARFKVSDAVLVGGGRDPVRRDGVGIDRDT